MAEVLASLLRNSPLLRAVPRGQRRRLLSLMRELRVPAGSPIFKKTDIARHMFLVASGRVKIYFSSGRRKRKTLAYLGPGAFFGEMALLDAKARSASAVAAEDSRLLVLHKRDFKRFLLENPGVCYFMLRTVSERLRGANEQIEGLLFRNVIGRVAKMLRDLAGRGRAGNGRASVGPYSRQELAELVGTTREPLSRALATLRRAGLVRVQGRRIVLCDAARLGELIAASGGE